MIDGQKMILESIAIWLKEKREKEKHLQEFQHLFGTKKKVGLVGHDDNVMSCFMVKLVVLLCLYLGVNFSIHWLFKRPFPTHPEAKDHRPLVVSRHLYRVTKRYKCKLVVTELSHHIDNWDGWRLIISLAWFYHFPLNKGSSWMGLGFFPIAICFTSFSFFFFFEELHLLHLLYKTKLVRGTLHSNTCSF